MKYTRGQMCLHQRDILCESWVRWQIGSEMQAILKWHQHCISFLNLCTLGQWPSEGVSKVVTGATQRRIKLKLEKFTELKTHLGSGQLTDTFPDIFLNNLFTNMICNLTNSFNQLRLQKNSTTLNFQAGWHKLLKPANRVWRIFPFIFLFLWSQRVQVLSSLKR